MSLRMAVTFTGITLVILASALENLWLGSMVGLVGFGLGIWGTGVGDE